MTLALTPASGNSRLANATEETQMLDRLFSIGQVLSIVVLLFGALLAIAETMHVSKPAAKDRQERD